MYSREDREWALYVLEECGGKVREAGRVTGISHCTISRWSREGPDATRKKTVNLPHWKKMELVRRLEAGESAPALAAECGVTPSTVRGWRRRLRKEGEFAMMTKDDLLRSVPEPPASPEGDGGAGELEELRRRNRELELRNAVLEKTVEILKKDPGADPTALSRAERAALVESLRGRFPLAALLAAAGLARSTYYYRSKAAARRGDRHAALREEVKRAFERSSRTYGYRRVRALLESEGTAAPERAVRRIMREEGLRPRCAALRSRRWSSYAGEEGMRTAPNLLLADARRDLHDFRPAAPWRSLATDITEFSLPDDGRKVYLSPVVDLYDGRVLAAPASTSPCKELAARTLAGVASAVPEGSEPILHSDRGWHYRTEEWVSGCEAAGIRRSMSRKGHSPDNAAMEGFFGALKSEMFAGVDWSGKTAEDLMDEIGRYVRWHNSGRLKAFREGSRTVYDTIDGRRRRLGLSA